MTESGPEQCSPDPAYWGTAGTSLLWAEVPRTLSKAWKGVRPDLGLSEEQGVALEVCGTSEGLPGPAPVWWEVSGSENLQAHSPFPVVPRTLC